MFFVIDYILRDGEDQLYMKFKLLMKRGILIVNIICKINFNIFITYLSIKRF